MRVYGHVEKEQVNSTVLMVAADGPARLKFSGFVSTNSEGNMYTVCEKPFSSLVDPDCYDLTTFCYRDEHRQLRYKFVAANIADREYIDQIAAKKGVRAVPFDKLPAWRPALASPAEIMHMIYLRLASVIHKEVLLGGGHYTDHV
ncbi:hypothetical protein B0H14DRAFT_3760719 [Mycena olivaceomarginata]|nr:hypothetical protein B0H14DRAFT_3760719 [Mycena olivaceomarginata]